VIVMYVFTQVSDFKGDKMVKLKCRLCAIPVGYVVRL